MKKKSSNEDLVLVIDQGGHASRAFTLDKKGRTYSSGLAEIKAVHSNNDHIEYSPVALLRSMQKAIEQAINGVPQGSILLAGMATQRSNIICWERNSGKPLSPIISWQDRRAAKWLEQKRGHASSVHSQTGLFLSPHYGASKLHWCLENIPEVKNAASTGQLMWGPMASWLVNQLCQEKPQVCDAVNASRTLLWSLQTGDWSQDLIQLFELDAGQLPVSVPNLFDFGTIKTSTNDRIPLRLVTGDQAGALFATGAPAPDKIFITAGTGAFLLSLCDQQNISTSDFKLLRSLILKNGNNNMIYCEGTVNGAGSALEYYSQSFNLPDYITDLPNWLADISNPPVFLNGHAGLGTPYMRANFKSRFINAGNKHEKMVAILESIIFLLQKNIELVAAHQTDIDSIVIGGGLSRYDGFCQRLADLGLPVIRSVQTETTSQGLAYLLFQQLDCDYQPLTTEQQLFSPQYNPALQYRFTEWHTAMEDAL